MVTRFDLKICYFLFCCYLLHFCYVIFQLISLKSPVFFCRKQEQWTWGRGQVGAGRSGGRGNYAKIQNSCEFQVKNLLFQSMKSNLLVSGHELDSLLSAFAGVR